MVLQYQVRGIVRGLNAAVHSRTPASNLGKACDDEGCEEPPCAIMSRLADMDNYSAARIVSVLQFYDGPVLKRLPVDTVKSTRTRMVTQRVGT